MLTEAIVSMTEGQCMDMAFQDRTDVDGASYFAMTERKTAALLEAAMACGATVAGGEADRIHGLAQFGRAFGLAFQARDDFLGIWGDPAVTGKPVGSDIERGKRSLPIALALSRSPDPERLSGRLAARDTRAVMAALEDLAVRSEVETIVGRLTEEALGCLESLADTGDAGRALEAIARTALGRVQ